MTTTYERYAGDAAENYQRFFVPGIGVPFARPVIEAAALTEGERVLDLACGTGVAARLAAEQVGPTGTVVGVDPTPAMLDVARAHAPEGPATEWHLARAEDLPLEDRSFDAVVCSLGYQFFTDKVAALREVRRVLVPGGRMALCTPGPTPPLFEAIDGALAEHIGPQASAFVHTVFSVHDPDEVRAQLSAAGLDEIEVTVEPLPLEVPPPADFLWMYLHSTPLAEAAAQLDAQARASLERDVVQRCQPLVEGGTLVMEPGLLLARGRRSGGGDR